MNQSLTGKAANILVTGRRNGKKQNRMAERRVCVFVCLHFYGTGITVYTRSWKYPSLSEWTESAPCILSERKEHATTVLTILFILPLKTPISLASHVESHSSILQTYMRQPFIPQNFKRFQNQAASSKTKRPWRYEGRKGPLWDAQKMKSQKKELLQEALKLALIAAYGGNDSGERFPDIFVHI